RLPQPNIKKGYSKEWPFLCLLVFPSCTKIVRQKIFTRRALTVLGQRVTTNSHLFDPSAH
ncbi:hypothetical protein, partial [Pseudomonas pergaminensis]